jgi:hypothetical protein
MKALVIIAALLMVGCREYTCIDGAVYRKLDNETWIRSGQWAGTQCTIIEETK